MRSVRRVEDEVRGRGSTAARGGEFEASVGAPAALGNQAMVRRARRGAVQRALAVGATTSPLEVEADRIAGAILDGGAVTRPTAVGEAQLMRSAEVDVADLAPGLEGRLERAESGGEPLAPGVARVLEGGLGVDLEGVRTHRGPEAAALSRSLGARAFTHGRHIFYGAGASPADLRLTAHEVVHTVQQGATAARGGAVQRRAGGTIQRDPDLSSGGILDYQAFMKKYTDVEMRSTGVMGPSGGPIGTTGLGPCAAIIVAMKFRGGDWVVGLHHYSGYVGLHKKSVADVYEMVKAEVQRAATDLGTAVKTRKYLIPGTETMAAHKDSIAEFEEIEGKFDNDWRALSDGYDSARSISVSVERKGGIFRSGDLKIKYYREPPKRR